MIDPNHRPAAEFWTKTPVIERMKMLEALKVADSAIAYNDYAAVPPEVQAGIVAGMVPPPPTEPEQQDDEPKSKKGHK